MTALRSLAWFAAGTLFAASAFGQVTLVRAGQPAAVVVTPDEPLPVVSYAAQELVDHVRLASGTTLPVIKASADRPDGRARVYLGDCPTSRQAFPGDWDKLPHGTALLSSSANRLCLAGRDAAGAPLADNTSAGTLFAVYEVLESFLKVRWLWPGELGTVVPPQATIAIPAAKLQVSPRFLHTRVRFGGLSITPTGFSSMEARAAFAERQMQWLRRHRFNRGTSLEYGHGFEDYWDRFKDTHPEYFNLLPDGQRRSDPMYYGGPGRLISMCVSEPGLARERAAEWAKTRTPERPWVNCAENDTCGKCTCPNCRALDPPGTITDHPEMSQEEGLKHATEDFKAGKADWWKWLGSVSDRYARFWLATQAEARKVDPEATVLAYAYANYNEPPRRTKLNDHIIVAIVPRLMYPWTEEKRAAFRKQWQGWADAGARLYLRPNYTLDGNAFPIFYAHKLAADFGFAAKHGLIATDFDSLTCQFGAQGPNLYVLARIQEHPDWTCDQIMAEYYAGFGPAAKAVQAYFAHWQQVSDQVSDETIKAASSAVGAEGGSWARLYLIADQIFTPAVMAKGEALLKQAEQAAAGDALAARRVGFLEKGLHHAELCLAVEKARRDYLQSGSLPDYQAAMQALDDYRASLEGQDVIGPGILRYLEGPVWDRSLLTALKQPGERLTGPWKFHFDETKQGLAQGWQQPDCADTAWSDITTNSAWEQQPVGKAWEKAHGQGYDGLAWYRTRFSLKPAQPGERVSLTFGAVDEACAVWVNGQQVLERVYDAAKNPNSWTEAFEVDVTPFVRYDQPNVLAVRVEDNSGAGGIWRPVWVVQSPPAAAGNLVPDGGFEAPQTAWKQHVAAGECRFSVDAAVSHGGKASGRIECVTAPQPDPTKAWARWYQTGLPVAAGTRCQLRVWVRTSADFAGTADVWFRSGGDNGDRSVKVRPTHGLWQQVDFENIVVGPQAPALYLNLMGATGTVWFDEVELVEQR